MSRGGEIRDLTAARHQDCRHDADHALAAFVHGRTLTLSPCVRQHGIICEREKHTRLPVLIPEISNQQVLSLCRRIHPSNKPFYVDVKPVSNAQSLECFMNVKTKANSDGGEARYGWALWQPSRFLLEGEHHAVYEPKSGPPWVDITPHDPPGSRILFLLDETAIFDMSTGQRRDNKRMPLVDDPRALEFCQLCSEHNDILNSVPGFGAVSISGTKARRLLEIEQRKAILMMELEQAHPLPTLGRNDPCPCGSGKKYKKCHGGSG